MIEVRGLTYSYGTQQALCGVDFSVERNRTVSIIGASGCGKTTLLYLLAGLLQKSGGSVGIDGTELSGVRNSTALIFQNLGLMPWKTVFDNVALGLVVQNQPRSFVAERTSVILEQLDIARFRDKYPGELSGGEKQRVAIGRALAVEPDLLLMDEPSSALDAITREHIQDLLLRTYKQRPLTMVLVTHSIEEAVFMGQTIMVMAKGRVLHTLDNPHSGDENSREKLDFYRECLLVRKWMDTENE